MEIVVKRNITLMVILLGLIFGVNQMFNEPGQRWFLMAFDTLALATMITILFGIRKETGYKGSPKIRRKIFAVLIVFVFAITMAVNRYLPKPGIYLADVFAIALIIWMYSKGYVVEKKKTGNTDA